MNDRELVELAAKAAGIVGSWHRKGFVVYSGWSRGVFDPLNDDGDALRLAVKMNIEFYREGVDDSDCVWGNEIYEWTDVNEFIATRRVITRAAAEIGKRMP